MHRQIPLTDADEPNRYQNKADDLGYDVGLICSRDCLKAGNLAVIPFSVILDVVCISAECFALGLFQQELFDILVAHQGFGALKDENDGKLLIGVTVPDHSAIAPLVHPVELQVFFAPIIIRGDNEQRLYNIPIFGNLSDVAREDVQ